MWRGPVAQLGARFHGMEEVVGSIPTRSTKSRNLSVCPPFTSITEQTLLLHRNRLHDFDSFTFRICGVNR